MPRGYVWGVYVADDFRARFAKLVDADDFQQFERGWTSNAVDTLELFPQQSRPRKVYGTSATTGRKGSAVIASTSAALWNGSVREFRIMANDGTVDVITVTRRVGERIRRGHL